VLCEKLGFPHPDFLLGILDWQQFTDWITHYTEDDDPHGPQLDRLMFKLKEHERGEVDDINPEHQSHSLI